jgi:hypothetical protein
VGIGTRLRQEGETEERMRALEAALRGQRMPAASVFDADLDNDELFSEAEL